MSSYNYNSYNNNTNGYLPGHLLHDHVAIKASQQQSRTVLCDITNQYQVHVIPNYANTVNNPSYYQQQQANTNHTSCFYANIENQNNENADPHSNIPIHIQTQIINSQNPSSNTQNTRGYPQINHQPIVMNLDDSDDAEDDSKSISYSYNASPVSPYEMAENYSANKMLQSVAAVENGIKHFDYDDLMNKTYLTAVGREHARCWVLIMNNLVDIHYDIGFCCNGGSLKPNVVCLAAEYLNHLVSKKEIDLSQINISNNHLIRMALYIAVKFDQGISVDHNKLFENWSKSRSEKEFIAWVRAKEISFILNTSHLISSSTRYQELMRLLLKVGFNVDSVAAEEYRNVKKYYVNNKHLHLKNERRYYMADNLKFMYLCRYLCEITYHKSTFYNSSKSDIAVGIILSAYVIAKRWNAKFVFENIEISKDLLDILYENVQTNQLEMRELMKKMIRSARAPHACYMFCHEKNNISNHIGEFGSNNNSNNSHVHRCDCLLNCCLNSYLKYSKEAFGAISQMVCLTTKDNIQKFFDWFRIYNTVHNSNHSDSLADGGGDGSNSSNGTTGNVVDDSDGYDWSNPQS